MKNKGRVCPLIDGGRERRLNALSKLAEISVILVALFVLSEFRSGQLPMGCSAAKQKRCLVTCGAEAQNLMGLCDNHRASCFDSIGIVARDATAASLGYPDMYNATFCFCNCLIWSEMSGDTPQPGYCVFSNIFPLLIFALGCALVVATECLLPRKVTSFVIFLSCVMFFLLTYIIMGSLSWTNPTLCQVTIDVYSFSACEREIGIAMCLTIRTD